MHIIFDCLIIIAFSLCNAALITYSAYGQPIHRSYVEYNPDISTWVEATLPQEIEVFSKGIANSTERGRLLSECAANSRYSWDVTNIRGNIYAVPHYDAGDIIDVLDCMPTYMLEIISTTKSRKTIYKVNNGWLIGTDAGEFGGELLWVSDDGKTRQNVLGMNTVDIIKCGNDLYAIAGLAHLAINEGYVFAINNANGRWSVNTCVELNNAPRCAVVNGSSIIIATISGIEQVQNCRNAVIYNNAFWPNPNSVAIDANACLYVGMRQGVMKMLLNGNGASVSYLVPDNNIMLWDIEKTIMMSPNTYKSVNDRLNINQYKASTKN